MRIFVSCELLDKRVEIDGECRAVYGLASYHVNPEKQGIGRNFVRELERIADRDGKYCIVGFCIPETLPFWQKCGWDVGGAYERMVIISSKPVTEIRATDQW